MIKISLLNWFSGLFSTDGTLQLDIEYGSLANEVYYKELAIQSCVNLIANTVSRGEFLTYEKGIETRKNNYYLFNVEPNLNKSASKFWRDVVHKLVYNNECLVIQQNGQFFVADSFSCKKFAFKENIYSGIVVAEFALKESQTESQVWHFELHNEKVKNIVESLYLSYSQLIAASMSHYKKNNARRGSLEIPTQYPQTEKAQKDLHDLLNVRFKRFFDAEGGAVLPLANGMKYEELSSNIGVKGGAEGRDVKAFIDDVFEFVSVAFQIPPTLLRGNVADTDKALANFLTFCINPLAETITDEVNRKLYKKEQFLQKTYLKLDTSRIRAVDIKDTANALDVLVRIGAYSVDDCLRVLGMEPLNTVESGTRFLTKNYAPITDVVKGGENIGNA